MSGVKVTVKAGSAFVVLNGLLDLTKHRGWTGVRIAEAKNGKRYLIVLRGGRVLARFEVGDVKQVRKPPTTGGDVAVDGTPDRDHFYVAPYHGYPLDRRLPGRLAGGERGTGLLVRFGSEVWESDWFGRFADRLEVTLGAGADSVLVSGGLLRPRTSGTTARIDLGPGNDRATLIAPKVPALVVGGPGNDVVDVRNGVRDVVDGGPGRDRVLADPIDVVRKAEVVSRG